MTTTVASFNVENLFSRSRAFSAESDSAGDQVIADGSVALTDRTVALRVA